MSSGDQPLAETILTKFAAACRVKRGQYVKKSEQMRRCIYIYEIASTPPNIIAVLNNLPNMCIVGACYNMVRYNRIQNSNDKDPSGHITQ